MNMILIFLFIKITFTFSFRARFQKYDTSTLKNALNKIVQSSETHDVTLIINQDIQDDRTQFLVDTIIGNVLPYRPTQFINIRETNITEILPSQRATSRTLLIYVYSGKSVPNMEDRNNIVVNAWNISYANEVPKLLLITILKEERVNFKEFLFYLWIRRILHGAILEATYCASSEPCLIVHNLNPFSNEYTKEPYSNEKTIFFPDKLRNLYGSPFYITPSKQFPYIVANKALHKDKLVGTMSGYLYAIKTGLNATLKVIENSVVYGSYNDMYPNVNPSEHERFDLDLYTILVIIKNHVENYKVTMPIVEERTCFCFPAMYDSSMISPWNVFITILVGSIALSVFWLFLVALRIDWRFGNTMNVIRLLLGIGIENELKFLTEKVLFLFLVVATTRYSSIFYTELFNLGVITDQELRIKNIEDLDRSGLPLVYADVHSKYYLSDVDMPENLKRRTKVYNKTAYGKVVLESDLLESSAALMADVLCQLFSIHTFAKKKRILRTSDYCPTKYYTAFPLAWRSPYKDRINDIVLRVSECSLSKRYSLKLSNYMTALSSIEVSADKQAEKSISAEARVLMIVFGGYFISVSILIGEILVHRMRVKKSTEQLEK